MVLIFLPVNILQVLSQEHMAVGLEPLMTIRIVDLATFIQIHGQSAMSRVIGFSPDRFLASISFTIVTKTGDCLRLFVIDHYNGV